MVLPDLKIRYLNSTVISAMNSSFVEYVFPPLMTSLGGQYTCTATVNIPQAGITDLTTSVTETIIVVCKHKINTYIFCHYCTMHVQMPTQLGVLREE